jgi:hypothetical protein
MIKFSSIIRSTAFNFIQKITAELKRETGLNIVTDVADNKENGPSSYP